MSDVKATFVSAAVASATAISTAAQVANNAALTLTASPYVTDAARKITITSGGNDSGISFDIVGLDETGTAASERVTGGNAGAVTSTEYYTSVTSITAVGDPAGTVSAGTSNNVGAPMFEGRMRLRGMYAVNTATGGTISFREGTVGGTINMQFNTVGNADSAEYPDIPDNGMLFVGGGYITYSAANMASITVFFA